MYYPMIIYVYRLQGQLFKIMCTIVLTSRHQGQLHTEVISTRLHGGRWRTYAIELSGNQLTVYVNCQRDTQRLVPLPDYCINDADVVVTVADTAYSHSEEFSGRERLHVSAKIGILCQALFSQ